MKKIKLLKFLLLPCISATVIAGLSTTLVSCNKMPKLDILTGSNFNFSISESGKQTPIENCFEIIKTQIKKLIATEVTSNFKESDYSIWVIDDSVIIAPIDDGSTEIPASKYLYDNVLNYDTDSGIDPNISLKQVTKAIWKTFNNSQGELTTVDLSSKPKELKVIVKADDNSLKLTGISDILTIKLTN